MFTLVIIAAFFIFITGKNRAHQSGKNVFRGHFIRKGITPVITCFCIFYLTYRFFSKDYFELKFDPSGHIFCSLCTLCSWETLYNALLMY